MMRYVRKNETRIEGAKLSVTMIKNMRGVDWEELGISFSTGKCLSRRAAVFEVKIKSKEW